MVEWYLKVVYCKEGFKKSKDIIGSDFDEAEGVYSDLGNKLSI